MHQKTSWTIQNAHHGLAFDWRVYAFRCAQKHFQFFRIRTVWISTNARTKFFWKCSRPFFKDTQSPKLNHKICIFSGVFSSDISFDCIFSPLFLISLFFIISHLSNAQQTKKIYHEKGISYYYCYCCFVSERTIDVWKENNRKRNNG